MKIYYYCCLKSELKCMFIFIFKSYLCNVLYNYILLVFYCCIFIIFCYGKEFGGGGGGDEGSF